MGTLRPGSKLTTSVAMHSCALLSLGQSFAHLVSQKLVQDLFLVPMLCG